MGLYINKSAVVAEIERRMKLRQSSYGKYSCVSDFVAFEELEYLHDEFLPTLEVKEVDLDKELNKYFITNNLVAADIQFEPVTQMKNCAKHFFELGISVGNKTNKIE